MSITKAQSLALADGFLDDGGSDEELQPRETFSELFLLAGEFIESAQDNLKKDNTNARGYLSESLVLGEPVQQGGMITVSVVMNEYGQYINKGVKGTKSGAGQFAFKTSTPSRKMVARMLIGIRSAKKKTTNVSKSRSVSKNEIKNKKLSELDHAWGTARNVKMYGIKATGFLDKAEVTTTQNAQDRLSNAFVIDLQNSF